MKLSLYLIVAFLMVRLGRCAVRALIEAEAERERRRWGVSADEQEIGGA